MKVNNVDTVVFEKWQKIGQFHSIRKRIEEAVDYNRTVGKSPGYPVIAYRAKIKLDGTNAAIRVVRGQFAVQSRSRFITVDSDNYGFAAFAHNLREWAFAAARDCTELAIYGEWCGTGIQKRCSVSQCSRMFVIFAIVVDGKRIVCPRKITKYLGELPSGVYVLDWFGEAIEVDYGSEASVNQGVNAMCKVVEEVEACDPWVYEQFGVKGLGEGIVYYATKGVGVERMPDDLDTLFKAKGQAHQNVKQLKPVLKDPEFVATTDAFVFKFVTEERLNQALTELGIEHPCSQDTGSFLKWIGNDVRSESEDERAISSIAWSHVAKKVSRHAKAWLFAKF